MIQINFLRDKEQMRNTEISQKKKKRQVQYQVTDLEKLLEDYASDCMIKLRTMLKKAVLLSISSLKN